MKWEVNYKVNKRLNLFSFFPNGPPSQQKQTNKKTPPTTTKPHKPVFTHQMMTLHSAGKQKTNTMKRKDTPVPLLGLRMKLRQSGTSSTE